MSKEKKNSNNFIVVDYDFCTSSILPAHNFVCHSRCHKIAYVMAPICKDYIYLHALN